MVLGEIQDFVNDNKISFAEYKKEFELSLKQNEYEIKKLLQALDKGYEERMRNIDNAQKISENNVIEVSKLIKIKISITNFKKIVHGRIMK